MIAFAVVASLAATSFFGGASPVVAPLDQASDAVLVGDLMPGARVSVYDDGFIDGVAQARSTVADVPVWRPLHPGDLVVAVERTISGAVLASRTPALVQHDYNTYHYDDLRTGWNSHEAVLTQSNVASSAFGKVFSTKLDGNVYAQPLFAANVTLPGQGTRDVVYAATENDSVYALDAGSGRILWHADYADGTDGYAPVPTGDENCGFIRPTYGITGTPVLDRPSGTLYFVAYAKSTANGSYHHFLHAVDITTGKDRPGSPVDIHASAPTGLMTAASFDPRWELQRPGLLLRNGVLYIAFGSFCDLHDSTARGWLLAYSVSGLSLLGAFDTAGAAPDGLSAIWAGGYGVAADESGALYFATGNGDFKPASGEWGDTVLRLTSSMSIADSFTPYNQSFMDEEDQDLGSGGPMPLPAQAGAHPHVLVEVGKTRTLYLIDRDQMGGYTPGGPDHILQELPGAVGVPHGVWGGPAYFVSPRGQPIVLYCGGQDHLKAFALMTSPTTKLEQVDESSMTFNGEGGAVPAVSSYGTRSGSDIAWAVERPMASGGSIELVAFDADDLTSRLADVTAGRWSNQNIGFFPVPTVIGGHAYVGTQDALVAFGLR